MAARDVGGGEVRIEEGEVDLRDEAEDAGTLSPSPARRSERGGGARDKDIAALHWRDPV
jgi:hypothetical protein